MYEKLLHDRMLQISEWKQTDGLNDLLADTLAELFAFNKECYNELAKNVADEYNPSQNEIVISTVVCPRVAAEKQKNFFYVCPEVNADPRYLATVFMECDYSTIKECLQNEVSAVVRSKSQTITTKARMRYSQRYLYKMSSLYESFAANEIPWTTLNAIYFYKFLDVYASADINTIEAIENVDINFGKYSPYVSSDKVLLWNVEELTMPAKYTAVPAGNAVQLEHSVANLPQGQYDYLLKPLGVRFTSFWRNGVLNVRTYNEQSIFTEISFLRIYKNQRTSDELILPIKSNRKEQLFSSALTASFFGSIATKGEAERIVYSMNKETSIRLIDVKLLPYSEDGLKRYDILDFNFFIHSNSFLTDRRLLLFSFSADLNRIWAFETMFYVIAELQRHFREYHCVGELV